MATCETVRTADANGRRFKEDAVSPAVSPAMSTDTRSGILAFFAPRPTDRLPAQRKRPREENERAQSRSDGAPDYLLSLRRRVMRRLAESTNCVKESGSSSVNAITESRSCISSVTSPSIASHQPAAAKEASTHCAHCAAPTRFCICNAADGISPVRSEGTAQERSTDSKIVRPTWASDRSNRASEPEEESQMRREMHLVLLKLEKQGVWLTSHGNKRGMGSASCGTSYCRTTREFSTSNVRLVVAMAVAGRAWGRGGKFRTISRLSQIDSFRWKNDLEAAFEAAADGRGDDEHVGGGGKPKDLTNGELIMGFALAGLPPHFGKNGREVNARFKAKLEEDD